MPTVQAADANALFPATRLVSWLMPVAIAVETHVPRPGRTDALTVGPLDQTAAAIEPSGQAGSPAGQIGSWHRRPPGPARSAGRAGAYGTIQMA